MHQALRVGAYVVGQHLRGVKRYTLVLMLEPLFRCNLACAGCGKIDYPDPILNQRLSLAQCLAAVAECGASGASWPARTSSALAPTQSVSKRRSTFSSRTRISPGPCISTATSKTT